MDSNLRPEKPKQELDHEEEGIVEISPNGRYLRYDEILGSGAFKVVYKGFDKVYVTEIAWNQMLIDDDLFQSSLTIDKLLSEAVLVKSLKHENITKCYDSWVDDENKTVNMITELFTSGSLRQYRKKHKGVDMKAIRNWARQILQGLNYLHMHDPPIVHRDLKCDNVFVNGNHGEVKIGDLGFATMLQKGTTKTVMGTPEFMAPELFEDEYNELVDIYSFGMCVLELVTREYPYSECKNAGQVYKKVLSGAKPAALEKVKDLQVKQFMEKCLVPASQRLPAAELLKDPFLSTENLNSKETTCQPIAPKSTHDSQISMDIGSSYGKLSVGTSRENLIATPPASIKEYFSSNAKKEFGLKGKRVDEKSIEFILQVTGPWKVGKYEFVFSLDADTALSVACEMVEQDELSFEDVAAVTAVMDRWLLELVPSWKPSDLSRVRTSDGDSAVLHNDQHPLRCSNVKNGVEQSSFNGSVIPSEFAETSEIQSCGVLPSNSSLNISSLTVEDHDDDLSYRLKFELDAIDLQFQQCCGQLLRMREEAIENAKKRWLKNTKMPVT